MKKSQIERMLYEESERNVPDVYDKILAANHVTLQQPLKQECRNQKNLKWRWAFMSGVAAVLLFVFILIPIFNNRVNTPSMDYTVVCVQMNPSVEMTVRNNQVSAVRALNTDAVLLLMNLQLVGLTPEDASVMLASAAQRSNYLTPNGVGLLVAGKDEKQIAESVCAALTSANFIVNRWENGNNVELQNAAKEYHVSEGKMALIWQILQRSSKYTAKQLAKESVEDLLEILEDYDERALDDFALQMQQKYQQEYENFILEVQQLLGAYRADILALKEMAANQSQELRAQIQKVNEKYEKLGSDFHIDFDKWDEIRPKDFDEYL